MRHLLSSCLLLACLPGCDDAPSSASDALAPDAAPVDAALDGAVVDGSALDRGALDRGLDAAVDIGTPDAALDAGADAAGDAASDAASDGAIDAGPPPGCLRYTTAQVSGLLPGVTLAEVSGIAASRQTPGIFWVHNDSGNDPRIYALTAEGQVRGYIPLDDRLYDLEDIAIARCPASERWCIFIADSGDNLLQREQILIQAVPEPPLPGDADRGEIIVDGISTLRRRYPDGPHDVEALVVAPEGDRLWLFSKTEGAPTRIFSSDTIDPSATLSQVGEFVAPGVAVEMGRLVTGADLHPSGARLAIRVYTGSFEYWLDARGVAGIGDLEPRQVTLGPLSEPQGEAIGYGADGRSLWTVSESAAGNQPLHRYDCAD